MLGGLEYAEYILFSPGEDERGLEPRAWAYKMSSPSPKPPKALYQGWARLFKPWARLGLTRAQARARTSLGGTEGHKLGRYK
ncbi:hypothetical protein PM082_014102 [Marasmius tenuissimus]|nr:hypothetical protein PM082_014102 [Marasmius tenuissimus]